MHGMYGENMMLCLMYGMKGKNENQICCLAKCVCINDNNMPPDKSAYKKIIFLISQPKHM